MLVLGHEPDVGVLLEEPGAPWARGWCSLPRTRGFSSAHRRPNSPVPELRAPPQTSSLGIFQFFRADQGSRLTSDLEPGEAVGSEDIHRLDCEQMPCLGSWMVWEDLWG